MKVRRTQGGCGGLAGENPAAFPKARPIFQQPFSLPESAQTLAGIAFRAAGKSGENFPAASNSKFAGKPFQQGISDSHSLLEFSEKGTPGRGRDGKCHDRASLSRPLVLSLQLLTSVASSPFSVLQRTLMGGAAGGL